MNNEKLVSILLRIGLAVVFLYAAVSATITPSAWIGYIPQSIRDIAPVPETVLLYMFSAYQVALAVWLLSGRMLFYAGMLAALTLSGIIVANISLLDVLFRDIAIFFSALALAALSRKRSPIV